MNPELIGLIGGIVGGIIGVAGGLLGTYFSIKNTNSPQERAFVIKVSIACWIFVLAFIFGMCLIPGFYKLLLIPFYAVGLVAGILLCNKKQTQIRLEESKKNPASPATPSTPIIPRRCPQCGAELKPDVSEGLCPACLLQRGIATEGGAPPGTPPFTPPMIPELEKLFPQLEILELIGKGGMGAVYKARQPALDRFVALKILAPRSGSDLDFASRFTREARALAKLSHPNIVGVYDFGRAELPLGQDAQQRVPATPIHYFIMEYVDGPNLRQVEQAGKLSQREALEIIPQICAALQFAHDEGIVHRDIKPENVLLDKKGRVKIADFGLAKILGQEPKDFRLTGVRDVVGTPHYMAPEQIEKPQEVDHRADIYSLGVVFYEMLTGELPLGKFQPPSSRMRGIQVDVRLDEVVLRALEKEPKLRYQQVSEIKTRVETIAATGSAGVPLAGSGVAPDSASNKSANEPPGATPDGTRVPWGMWSPFQSPEMREICAHLTKEERNQAALVSLICGVAYAAVMILAIQTWMTSTPGPGIWIVFSVLVILFIVCFPIGARMLRQLLCATAWARRRGYKPEQFRIFSFSGNNLWKGLGVLLVGLLLVFGQSKLFTHLSGTAELTQSLKADAVQTKKQMARLAAQKKTPALAFGPLIEHVINLAGTRTNFLIAFKTGHLRTPPSETAGSSQAIYDWARHEGVDAGAGIINKDVLSGFDMAVIAAPAQCWEELSPAQAAGRLDLESSGSFKVMSYGNPSALPDTCVFRTREGGIGILQVTEYLSNPPGLKVRYKFLDKLPAAMQRELGGIAAEWSPVLFPGEKPDLQKILDEAKKLTSTGHFEEALQHYLWHHNHAQEFGDAWQNAVRLTSALSDWEELGRRYPKAKQALIEIRDNKTREIAEGRGYSEIFQEVQAINRELQDDDATVALFKIIHQRDKKLAGECYGYAENLLMQKGEYELCLNCIGDPQSHFESCRRGLEMQRESQQRMEEMRKQHPVPVPRLPRGAFTPPDMGQMATNNFIGQVCKLVEILVATGHRPDAEKIQDQAVTVLDDARLKSAVSDAEEKIQKRAASDSQPQTRDAVSAAQKWLALIDGGNYSETWKEASAIFRGAVTEPGWENSMNTFRQPLGDLISRKLKSAQLMTELPGAPDGLYVVMQFETSFAGKKTTIETVTFMLGKDGQWKSAGYFIK